MKKIILLAFILLCNFKVVTAKITLKIHEPIRFKNVNTTAFGELIVGEGSIEVSTDTLYDNELEGIEGDFGKKLIFRFPENGLITNKKKMLKIEKYIMEDGEKEFVIEKEKKVVKIYALLPRKNLNDGIASAEEIEGEYVGIVPIVVSQMSKIINDKEEDNIDKPILLPGDMIKPNIKPGDTIKPNIKPGDTIKPNIKPGDNILGPPKAGKK